ncbi:MAG: hypothetical protein WBW04_21875, partial [Nitrolancea sp.]
MRQVLYAMQFKGSGGPTEEPNVLQAATSSPSSQVTSIVGASGLGTRIEPAQGQDASFTSEVRLTGDTSFTETGKIVFGGGSSLTFSTIGEGYLAPSPEDGLNHGAVMWRVESGEGQFAGASGIITSNFTFSAQGEVIDNQFGLIWVK